MSWVKLLPQNMTESSGQNVNPAESVLTSLSHRLAQQEQLLPRLMEQLTISNQRCQQLESMVRQLHESISMPRPSTSSSDTQSDQAAVTSFPGAEATNSAEETHFRVAPSPATTPFGGEFEDCRSFLLQCRLAFERSPAAFRSDSAKISYVVGLLRGRALRWAEAKSHNDSFLHGSFRDFVTEFTQTFGSEESISDIRRKLMKLSQGRRTVADLAVEFRTLAARTTWDEDALIGVFTEALNDRIRNQLALCPEPKSLDELIKLAISVDKRHREVRRTEVVTSPSIPGNFIGTRGRSTPDPLPTDEPMQMGRAKLSQEEKEHRRRMGLCLYCGLSGHYVNNCSSLVKGERPPVRPGLVVGGNLSSTVTRCSFSSSLFHNSKQISLKALVDSGCEQLLLDPRIVAEWKIPTTKLITPRSVSSLDNRNLSSITHQTIPLRLQVSGNHVETLTFYVFPSPQSPLVLGHSWLVRHNPILDWRENKIVEWDSACSQLCLRSAILPTRGPVAPPAENINLATVPQVYHDLRLVFSKDRASSLPPHRPYDCAIDLLPGAPLPTSRLYQLSKPERESMEEYIQECLAAGTIRPSSSPLGAGFFFVPKKDGTLRPCIDYRGLNQITVKNKYPLPLLSSTFEPVQDSTIFTRLDLRNAYHLVRVKEGDEWKTAFKTPVGHYEYLVMPFVLTNAPVVFQSLVNSVLGDFLNRFVTVYLDDILIFSKNPEQHVQHVRAVLQRLLENRLYVKAEKCKFHVPTVKFLGFVIEGGRLRADPEKVQAVTEWPTPTTRKQLQRFLGFANFYRRFIRNFSQVAAPLTQLTSVNKTFVWSPEAESAFRALKRRFADAPILHRPDPQRQFTLEVDASDTGVGAVLSQVSEEDKRMHPCAFFSRRLTPTESRYDVGDRELLAVKLAIEEWRHWLEGAEQPFLIWTDHKNRIYLKEAKRLNPRQYRWSLFFSRFNFLISYRPGSKNTKPDALSRQYAPDRDEPPSTILPPACVVGSVTWDIKEQVLEALKTDPGPDNGPSGKLFVPQPVRGKVIHWAHTGRFSLHLGVARTMALIKRTVGSVTWEIREQVLEALKTDPGPDNGPPGKLFVPQSVRGKVIHWAHAGRFSLHPGVARTVALIKRTFWWPSIFKDTKDYISGCHTCSQHKGDHRLPAGLLQPLPTPSRPWSHIALDFVCGLPISHGFTYILTIVDWFSKACHLVPLKSLPSSTGTAQLLVKHVFRLHGIPEEILSDRGPQFVSQVWREFAEALGAKVALTSGHHPQTNGQCERMNQELGAMLRCVCSIHPSSWSTHLPWVEYAHNSHISTATGQSPFEASL
uniref:Gypsy retrotransposon integrase-like protein 1 n=1 Tax=Nothobranchius furzeri TaxID=105023 RepID=A0A8C6LVF1_NOTFU